MKDKNQARPTASVSPRIPQPWSLKSMEEKALLSGKCRGRSLLTLPQTCRSLSKLGKLNRASYM